MKLRYVIVCILILAIVVFLASKIYNTRTHQAEFAPAKEMTKKAVAKIETPQITEEKKESSNDLSHTVISKRNIFNPERKDFPIQTGPEGKRPIVRPQIILYGVTMAGDYQSASIANPGRPLKKGEREAMILKIGDRVGGYKLSKILPDQIALEALEDTFEVLLHDLNKPKQRIYAKAETKPAAITTVLPTSPGSSTTSSPSPQITPSQEAPKASESIRETKTQAPETSSGPPYPYPTLRSRRAGTESSPLAPIEPAETLTRPKSL